MLKELELKIRKLSLKKASLKQMNIIKQKNRIFMRLEMYWRFAACSCASHEGIMAVEHINGENPAPIDYTLVSKCIYTSPEVASVGYTEEEAKEKGYKVKVGKFPLRRLGKRLFMENQMVLLKLLLIKKPMIFLVCI